MQQKTFPLAQAGRRNSASSIPIACSGSAPGRTRAASTSGSNTGISRSSPSGAVGMIDAPNSSGQLDREQRASSRSRVLSCSGVLVSAICRTSSEPMCGKKASASRASQSQDPGLHDRRADADADLAGYAAASRLRPLVANKNLSTATRSQPFLASRLAACSSSPDAFPPVRHRSPCLSFAGGARGVHRDPPRSSSSHLPAVPAGSACPLHRRTSGLPGATSTIRSLLGTAGGTRPLPAGPSRRSFGPASPSP